MPPKPVIMTVDDEPAVLNAVERDLRQHLRSDYRIIKAGSGREALETARKLKERNYAVAMFLVDERMPEMSGTQFLAQARAIYPDARKVLLTAYADTEAAISSINDVGLDHYLLKPWDPPSERLFPVVDDLLDDWQANYRPAFDGIRVIGDRYSPQSHEVKDFLTRNQVPYRWLDLDDAEATRNVVETVEDVRFPIVIFPDGSRLEVPTNQELAAKIGLQTQAQSPFYDLVIAGGGPAGLAAAVYAASEGLKTVIIEKSAPGGQAGTSSKIENYLGFPAGLSGSDLARRALAQARRFGAELLTPQEVVSISVTDAYKTLKLADGSELSCHGLIVATGVSYRRLEAPGLEELTGSGVYYGAAMTEAELIRGEDIFMIGGANSAGQGALHFSQFARKVVMLVRGDSLDASMSKYLIDRITDTENIEVRFRTEVKQVHGQDKIESLTLLNRDSDTTEEFEAAGLFIFIGAAPRTEWLQDMVACDGHGFILTGHDLISDPQKKFWNLDRDPFLLETSLPGSFAAGDVRHGSGKHVATAVGEGSTAVMSMWDYLDDLGL